MKYFFDTEFIEGFHKPLFGKRRHFIDLISIGIVDENGRAYHAISSEYSFADADDWVKEHVITPLYIKTVHGDMRNHFDVHNFHLHYGRSNRQIKEDILDLTGCWHDSLFWRVGSGVPEFYAYYADYDWVVFCSLFGRMIDLPRGFPMYCRDLKQSLDEKVADIRWDYHGDIHQNDLQKKDRPATLEEKLEKIKKDPMFPKQLREHNALDDAQWNQQLYKFIQNLNLPV